MQSLLPIPNAPTDNLYKFLALSGVALAIAGFGIPAIALRDYNDKALDAVSDRFVIDADRSATKEELDSLHQEIVGLRDEVKGVVDLSLDAGVPVDVAYRAKVEKDNDYLLAQHNALHARANDVQRRLAALQAKNLVVDMLREDAIRLRWIGAVLGALGSVLAYFGFSRWYSLYQKPQDDQIVADINARKVAAQAVAAQAVAPADAVNPRDAGEVKDAHPPANPPA